jgi:hypothetical protein
MTEEEILLAMLPPKLRAYALESKNALNCPTSYVIAGMLAALSIAIGGKLRLRIKKGWTECAALFIMVIGEAGWKKTPGVIAGLKPILDLQIKLGKEGIYIVTTDATSEAIFALLARNPLLLYRDEIWGLWKGMNQYKNGGDDMERYLQSWSQLAIIMHRKGSETIQIDNPYLATIGGLQTGLLPDLFALKDNGLRDRFLMIAPDKIRIKHTDDEISESAYENYKSIIWWIYDTQSTSEPKVIYFSVKAQEAWKAWHIKYCDGMESDELPYNMQGVYSKMEAYTARLSLILEYAYCAEESRDIKDVSEKSLANAIILSEYFLSQAHKVYNSYGTNILDKKVSALVSWLRTRPNKDATARDVYTNQVAGIKTTEAAYDLFTELHKRGLALLFTNKSTNGKNSYTIKLTIKQSQSNN